MATGYAPIRGQLPGAGPPKSPSTPFEGLAGSIPREYFWTDKAAQAKNLQGRLFDPLMPLVNEAPDVTGGHGYGNGGLIGREGMKGEDIWKNAGLAGVLSNTNTIADMFRGQVGLGQGLSTIGGAIGDNAAMGYLDRATGMPISTFAPLAHSLISSAAPGSLAANVSGWVAHPASSAINAIRGTGGQAATGAGFGAAGTLLAGAGALYGGYQTIQNAMRGDKKNSIISGAMTGAAAGSIIPGLGTLVGGAFGALAGLTGASLGDKDQASEIAYGDYKQLGASANTRDWSGKDMHGALFEAFKSHTKDGNYKRFEDVGDLGHVLGTIDPKAMGAGFTNVIGAAVNLAKEQGRYQEGMSGQDVFKNIVSPYIAMEIEKKTGKAATSNSWSADRSSEGGSLHSLLADYTDWYLQGNR